MKLMYSDPSHFRWTCGALSAAVAMCAHAASPTAQPVAAMPTPNALVYSVVNLAPGAGVALLNQQGQAAFSTYAFGEFLNGFFDGKRVYRVGPASGGDALVRGLNDLGVVVGQFNDAATPAPFNYRAFTWTVAGGLRALSGPGMGIANAINQRNEAVGAVKGNALYSRAYRWNPDGTALELGPLPASLSEAIAINDSGISIGYADVAQHDSHAVVWDTNGNATDLGTLGGTQSTAQYINRSGQVVGTYYRDGVPGGFLWSRKGGLVKIAPDAPAGVQPTALNDAGDVAVNLQIASNGGDFRFTPFVWSAAQGRRALPLAGASSGSVDAMNNRGGSVGYIDRNGLGPLGRRAVRWQGRTLPSDLNGRLHNAPAGLVLYAGKAINDKGDILAESNAGLVLLRPGLRGSDAPALGPINTDAPEALRRGDRADFTVAFTDTAPSETHTSSASVNDGCAQEPATVREVRGNGVANVYHTFCRTGSFVLKIKVTDRAGNATEAWRAIDVWDPAAAAAPR